MTGGSKPAYKSLCDLNRMFLFFRVWLLKEKSNHTRETTCFFLLLWLTSPGNLIQQQLSTAIYFLDEWPLCKMNEWLHSSTGGLSKCASWLYNGMSWSVSPPEICNNSISRIYICLFFLSNSTWSQFPTYPALLSLTHMFMVSVWWNILTLVTPFPSFIATDL